VRHAQPEDLVGAKYLVDRLRRNDQLVERKPGTFYRKSRAFLHFHADPAGLFVDVRVADEFERLRVTTRQEQTAVLALVTKATAPY
jgi:hypothetical protein